VLSLLYDGEIKMCIVRMCMLFRIWGG